MTYSVYQHWDPLKVCIVGRSYTPEFYHFIKNSKVRSVMERIAYETEEDYQKLIKLLEFFGVEVLRPDVQNDYRYYLSQNKINPPPMNPCDWTIMIGETFYYNLLSEVPFYNRIKDKSWPVIRNFQDFDKIEQYQKEEVYNSIGDTSILSIRDYKNILKKINLQSDIKEQVCSLNILNRANVTRIGKDLYFGTTDDNNRINSAKKVAKLFPNYRTHIIDTKGHSDGSYCPVVPGLIISLLDIQNYKKTFPGWEVIYLPDQSWHAVKPFLALKEKNRGKWWVPGEELNNDFTNFVENWLDHWVGYVEETVFDVNMLVINEKNVVCNNYNEKVFRAFERYGITPHIINFRHRYFWDGGLHCITSDVHREGTMKDYFPERG